MSNTIYCVAPSEKVLVSFDWKWNGLFGHYTLRVTILDRWNEVQEYTEGPYAPSVRKNVVEASIRNKVERLYGPVG
jgi:hypothetical protein